MANNGISWKGEMAWPLLSPDNKTVTVSNIEKCASDKYDQICFCLKQFLVLIHIFKGGKRSKFSSNFMGLTVSCLFLEVILMASHSLYFFIPVLKTDWFVCVFSYKITSEHLRT